MKPYRIILASVLTIGLITLLSSSVTKPSAKKGSTQQWAEGKKNPYGCGKEENRPTVNIT